MISEYNEELRVYDSSAKCYKNWFNITNTIIMVMIASSTTVIITSLGHVLGKNLLQHSTK